MAGRSLAIVVGASRGIGLAIVEALSKAGEDVVATARSDAPELRRLGVEVVTGIDVAADDSSAKLVEAVRGRTIGLLIVVAGIQELDNFETVTKDSMRRQFETNAIGPLFLVKALQPRLQHGAKVVLLSSRNASIEDTEATGGELYGYRASKVAINIIGRTLAIDLKKLNDSPVALIHPGVVLTDMLRSLRRKRGTPEERLADNTKSPGESASRVLALVDGLSLENTGQYWSADTGRTLPW